MGFPVVDGPITQGFGCTNVAIEPSGALFGHPECAHYHSGVDIGVADGTPVKATGPGTVIFAGWDSTGFGNAVRIDHGNGVVSLYGHLTSVGVSVGQQVSTGDVIGLSGHTGNATGPHVHYEIDINGVPVDPSTLDPSQGTVPATNTAGLPIPQIPKQAIGVGVVLLVLALIDD